MIIIKDYTEIFTRAIEYKSGYDAKKLGEIINAHSDLKFGDPDEWADKYWYMLSPALPFRYEEYYGYLSYEYPVALLTERCPEKLKRILDENKILYAELIEPMSCNENILRQYVHHKMVFDERFLDNCDYSYDDERFYWVLWRLETGHQQYVDSSNFMFKEIR